MSSTAPRRIATRVGSALFGLAATAFLVTACGSTAAPSAGGGPTSAAVSSTSAASTAPSATSTADSSPSASSPPPTSSTEQTQKSAGVPLEGTFWALVGATDADGTSVLTADSTVDSTMEITDGRLLVNAGCNTGSASAAVDGSEIAVGPMAMTAMACDDEAMEVEALVVQVYDGTVDYAIAADLLTITSGAGTLTYKADSSGGTVPDGEVEGTAWTLTGAMDASGATVATDDSAGATLEIVDGRANIATGCNTGSGSVEVTEDTMTFGPVATTRMACIDEKVTRLEQTFLAVLEDEAKYNVSDGKLVITNRAGTLIFEAPNPAESVPAATVPSELTTGMTAVTRNSGGMLPSIPEDPTTMTK